MTATWRRYLLVGLAVSAVCVALPVGVGRDVLYCFIGASSAAAILVGVRRNQPAHPAAWGLFAAGTATWASADGLYAWYEHVALIAPFPSWADVLYLAVYPLFGAGLVMLGRSRGAERGPTALDETAILTVGLGLVAWVYLIAPTWVSYQEPLLTRLVGVGYPLCDVLLFAMLARLTTSGAAWNPAFRLVAGSVGALLLADALFAAGTFVPAIAAQARLLDFGWLLSYVLWGTAALHPSMRQLSLPPPPRTLSLSTRRLVLLMAAVGIGPAILCWELIAGHPLDAGPIILAGGVTAVLVINRVRRMVGLLDAQTERLSRLADTDYVTGLANSRRFVDRLNEILGSSRPEATGFLLVDLARLSEMDNTLGRRTADAILSAIGTRLVELTSEHSLVARMGSDLFGVLDPSITSSDDAGLAATRIRIALERPLELPDLTVSVEVSVGALVLPVDGSETDVALLRADVALTAARARAGRTARYGIETGGAETIAPLVIRELRGAIEHGELVMHYQPQVEILTGRVLGVEALVRWQHPRLGLLAPDTFIPAAEQTGLIGPLTQHVLDSSLMQCASWLREGLNLTVAVNLSVRNLLDPGLVDDVRAALMRHGLEARSLELEITESSAMVDPRRSIEVLGALAQLGVMLSIDDYGTGHSSLAYLQRLPVRRLKIDRSFVSAMTVDPASAAIVASTIELARVLRFDIVAEGVEDDATLLSLRDLSCYAAQGYGLGHPVAAPLLPDLVKAIEGRLPAVLGSRLLSGSRPNG